MTNKLPTSHLTNTKLPRVDYATYCDSTLNKLYYFRFTRFHFNGVC